MTSSKILLLFLIISLMAGCGGDKEGKEGTTASGSLVSIKVTPDNLSITVGAQQQFAAAGTYSDNSSQDITSSVTWTSSFPAVATVSTTGMVSSVGPGTTTITASSGSLSDSAAFTVKSGGGSNNTVSAVGNEAYNVIPITVNGALCSADSYLNKPCVSVTVCTPGGSLCQTISDILLDTGSTGLRIFKQALNVILPAVTSGSGVLGNCIHYGDGTAHWGPVRTAGVILGNEPVVVIPIQVIDATFGPPPAACQNADKDPDSSGFNGILGVGLFTEDCGPGCALKSGNGMYYSCSGSSCSGAAVPLPDQVQNPVAHLPLDNNGVLVQLPPIPEGGVSSVDGRLVLGIGTQSNNTPEAVTAYKTDEYGNFVTSFYGATYSNSFIDSGSNGIFFTPPLTKAIPTCPVPNSSWFCPSSTLDLAATTTEAGGSISETFNFQIGNLDNLTNSSNKAFSLIGAVSPGVFDWGLPFYFGRDVYVGIEGRKSGLGLGPYWAY